MLKHTDLKGGSAPPSVSFQLQRKQCIMATKALLEKPVQRLREGLNRIDVCSEQNTL